VDKDRVWCERAIDLQVEHLRAQMCASCVESECCIVHAPHAHQTIMVNEDEPSMGSERH
jgi:hypothetical protein